MSVPEWAISSMFIVVALLFGVWMGAVGLLIGIGKDK